MTNMQHRSNKRSLNLLQYQDAQVLETAVAARVSKYIHKKVEQSELDSLDEHAEGNDGEGKTFSLSDYSLDECLGQGSFSSAFSVQNNDNVVLKMLQPKLLENVTMFAHCAVGLVKEGLILSKLNHDNIVECHGMSRTTDLFLNGRHDSCVLLLEKIDCTLQDKLVEWKDVAKHHRRSYSIFPAPPTLPQRLSAVHQLADALQYLHAHRILHRDLKPENIGFSGTTLKLIDFDLARIQPQGNDIAFRMTKRMGTPRYMAPEVASEEEYNLSCDTYSFALIAHQLLSLKKPFAHANKSGMAQIWMDGERPSMNNGWPTSLRHILQAAWSDSLYERPSMAVIVEELREVIIPDVLASAEEAAPRAAIVVKKSTRKSLFSLFKLRRNHHKKVPSPKPTPLLFHRQTISKTERIVVSCTSPCPAAA